METKRATPRDDCGPGSGQTVSKIFLGGLKDGVSDENLKEYFGAFGTVVQVEQMTDKTTGRKRGFGFVEFEDYDAVDKIMLQTNNHVVNGYKIDVKKAVSKSEMGGGRVSYLAHFLTSIKKNFIFYFQTKIIKMHRNNKKDTKI